MYYVGADRAQLARSVGSSVPVFSRCVGLRPLEAPRISTISIDKHVNSTPIVTLMHAALECSTMSVSLTLSSRDHVDRTRRKIAASTSTSTTCTPSDNRHTPLLLDGRSLTLGTRSASASLAAAIVNCKQVVDAAAVCCPHVHLAEVSVPLYCTLMRAQQAAMELMCTSSRAESALRTACVATCRNIGCDMFECSSRIAP